jgi:hypothetical protein
MSSKRHQMRRFSTGAAREAERHVTNEGEVSSDSWTSRQKQIEEERVFPQSWKVRRLGRKEREMSEEEHTSMTLPKAENTCRIRQGSERWNARQGSA